MILKTGANITSDKNIINSSFKGHMDNINKLVEEGKLIVAGPLGKNDKDYRGIFNWYGSAALPEYLPFSDKIWKQKP